MKFKIFIPILVLGMALISCENNFEDINDNPNNPSSTDPNYIFNYVVKEGAGEYGIVSSYNITYVQRWIMQTAAVYGNSTMPPYTLFDQYRIQNLWQYYYTELGMNNNVLENLTTDDATKNGIAKIWKIYCFHKVTDLWGDVPYSEAWGITENTGDITVTYDTQEEIYTSFLSELKNAANQIEVNGVGYSSDMIFDGNLDLWVKFANTLRLRLALRSGNEAVIDEVLSEDNLISSAEESAIFEYIESQDWWNPYYEINQNSKNPSSPDLTGTTTPKIAELLKRQLETTNDPRLEIYAQPIEINNVTYVGVPNLMDANKKENQAMGMGVMSTSYIGRYFTESPTFAKQLLSYAEVCFLRAEIAHRGWSSEDAKEWYDKGVEAAMEWYEITAEDITTFLEGPGLYNNTLEQIITQKWIALYLDGWEAYAEYRRTGYPQLMKWDLEIDNGPPVRITAAEWVEVPREYVPGRLPYPDNEKDLNVENYSIAVENQGGDDYYQQVWWAKKFGEVNY